MNSDCNWQLVNKLLADQKLINGRICDNTFKIQKDNIFYGSLGKKKRYLILSMLTAPLKVRVTICGTCPTSRSPEK